MSFLPLRRRLIVTPALRQTRKDHCQRQAGGCKFPRDEFPSHNIPQGRQRQQSALRSFLVRIHVRLHLQIVQ